MGLARLSLMVALAGGLSAAVGTGDPAHANDLTIGAAWSMKPAFQEILPMFEKEYGATVKVVYGPSPVLRRQIEQGAPIDVFLPAGLEDVRQLQRKGMTLNGGVRVYALTSLVLVMASDVSATALSLRDHPSNRVTRLALGHPTQSSLGEATAKALAGLDNRTSLVHAPHGHAVVDLVRGGRADAGIVFRVDAINSTHIRIVDEAPSGEVAPVPFGQAVVWTCRESSRTTAEDFFNFMISPRIQLLLVKYGFDPAS
ncbi:MAG: molybdate ABC transporter substrate-binding protein [Nitrospiraceae bacterium]|nr:molybdate ABC transporter substrate-binding protein [Nitrospiraceae bacterium]